MAGASVAEVAQRHGVNPNLIFAWRRGTQMGALPSAVESQRLIPITGLADREAGLERRAASARISIEFEVGARLQVESIPDPATLSNVLVCLAASERRR